ncbi:Hsp20/alpha crystallin family protein, partial [Vibrio parahaemolyticus]
DRLFDDMFRDFSLPSLRLRPGNLFGNANALLQPNMDIASTDKEYTVTVEIPGVDENDIKLELSQEGILTVRGEKKQEKEHK